VEGPSLLAVCNTVFAVVFLVLSLLAVVIQLISLALPARAPRGDAAVVAAISAAVATQHAGAKVVRIVEEK
jgi:Na+-transporting methylmalonyl-CoA/oxaloacetate decarboxylase gamma subunit